MFALVSVIFVLHFQAATCMTSQTTHHFAWLMRAFTFFHQMSDGGVVEQLHTRIETCAEIVASAARVSAGGSEYEFAMRIYRRTDSNLRQLAAMFGVTARTRLSLIHDLLVEFGYGGF